MKIMHEVFITLDVILTLLEEFVSKIEPKRRRNVSCIS
jgi:hypothetical protein